MVLYGSKTDHLSNENMSKTINLQSQNWTVPDDTNHKDLKVVYQIVGSANVNGGLVFGGFVRDVVLCPKVVNPKFNDLDLWFADVSSSQQFIKKLKSSDYVLEENPEGSDDDDDHRYFVYGKGQAICKIDIVVSKDLPVDDFEVNRLMYSYINNELYMPAPCDIDQVIRMANVTGANRETVMLASYAKRILTADDRQLRKIAERIDRCFLWKLWAIRNTRGEMIKIPNDPANHLIKFREAVRQAFPKLIEAYDLNDEKMKVKLVPKTESKTEHVEPKIEKAEPKTFTLIYETLDAANKNISIKNLKDPAVLDSYYGLISYGFTSNDVNGLNFAFDELISISTSDFYRIHLQDIRNLMLSLLDNKIQIPLPVNLRRQSGLSAAIVDLLNSKNKCQVKMNILSILIPLIDEKINYMMEMK